MSHDTYFAAIYDQVLQFLKICKLSAAKKVLIKTPGSTQFDIRKAGAPSVLHQVASLSGDWNLDLI